MDALVELQNEIVLARGARPYDEECLDDWLERLLSVLAELPEWNTHDDDSSSPPTTNEEPNTRQRADVLDQCLVTIAGQTLEEPSRPLHASAAAFSSSKNQTWRKGWELLATEILKPQHDGEPSAFPPTRIHATATLSSLPLSNTQAFTTTCLLLSCHALKRVDSCTVIRRKRWRSTILETIGNFQRGMIANGSRRPEDTVNANGLFCHYMMPAMEHALDVLDRETTIAPRDTIETRHFGTIFRAAAVHCIVSLAGLQDDRHSEQGQMLTEQWNVLARIAPTNPIEWLATHHWRQHHHARILGRTRCDNIDGDGGHYDETVHLTRLTTLSDAASDDEMSDGNEEVDGFVGFATHWPTLSVAQLVTSEAAMADLPCVWSPFFLWHLLFPSLATRMAAELEWQSTTTSSVCGDHHQPFGLLVVLLAQVPDHALTCPRTEESPNDPFPVFQWLVNAMMMVAGSQKVTISRDQNAKPASTYYAIMNELLQRYRPESQFYIITQQLYRRCPYPAVRPKIVDLLRRYGQWPSNMLREDVWTFIETAIVQSSNEEETMIALLNLFEVSPPDNVQQRLERIDGSLETSEQPLLAFTMERIKGRLSSV